MLTADAGRYAEFGDLVAVEVLGVSTAVRERSAEAEGHGGLTGAASSAGYSGPSASTRRRAWRGAGKKAAASRKRDDHNPSM